MLLALLVLLLKMFDVDITEEEVLGAEAVFCSQLVMS